MPLHHFEANELCCKAVDHLHFAR